MKCLKLGLLAQFLFFALTTSSFAKDITEADVISMTDKAVALIAEKGDAALDIIGKKDGEYHKGALYVFVYDTDVNIVAHPAKPSLVGKNYKGKPDVKGNKFRDKIVETALNGGGWTEYFYQKPDAPGLYKKKVYSKIAEHGGKKYAVACGIYIGKI